MRLSSRIFSVAAIVFSVLGPLATFGLAQYRNEPSDAEACAACGTCAGGMIIVPLVFLALNIALLVWVARDAKDRGMDNAVLWMVLVMITSVVGLIIYLLSRPQGLLIPCPHCNNKRLQASAKCPHCANP